MFQAMANLGHAHVSSLWAYQGSKPFHQQSRLYSSLGDTVHCVDLHSEEVIWKHNLFGRDEDAELLDSVVTPPVLVNNKVFACTVDGAVVVRSTPSPAGKCGEPRLANRSSSSRRWWLAVSTFPRPPALWFAWKRATRPTTDGACGAPPPPQRPGLLLRR